MVDVNFLKDIEKCSKELVDNLDNLLLCGVCEVPLKIRTEARGIRLICDRVHHATWEYLQTIEGTATDSKEVYTISDLIIDLLVGAYLFISISGTSYHYYEEVLVACDEYSPDEDTWELFHRLKESLEQVYTLNLL